MPEKKKAQKSLPPKPSTFSDEQWEVAHSAAKLLELLAAPDKASHSASSKSGEKPVASKPSAALWLCQLLGSSSEACEDAFKAGAVETCAKLIGSQSCDAAVLASALGALSQLANPATGPQAPQVREAIMTVRPAVIPALLTLLEQASGSYCSATGTAAHHSSTSAVAAALGLLAILASASDTRLRVTKLVAGWNMKPLVAALASQRALPLEGGRNASAEAAAILETICAPAASQMAAADSAGESKKGGKKGGKGDAEGGKKEAAAPVGDPVDPTLTAAVQQAVLAAEGTTGLLKLCAAVGSPAAARVSAVAALQHLMAAHGREESVKAEFAAAGGVPTMLKLMVSTTLPLPARAAAAGCIWHYLAPHPADTAGVADAPDTAPAAGARTPAAATVASALSPRGAMSRSITSPEARSNIIAAAKNMRKQQREGSSPEPAASKGRNSATATSMSGGSNSTRPSIAAAAAGPPGSSSDTPSLDGQGTAAKEAANQSSLSVWDAAAVTGLACRAEEVIQAGVVPALLVLCCGPEGPPPGLAAAAVRAAAAADAAQKAAKAGSSRCSSAAAGSSAGGSDVTAADSSSLRLPAGNGWSGLASEGLGAIAEPSQGEEGAEEDETGDGYTAAASAAAAGEEPAEGKKKGKKGKKGSSKVDPVVQTAQSNATAAVNLLALSGDAGRTALQDAGARAVLVPLLSGPTTLARWSARQALMSLALTSSRKPVAKSVTRPVSGLAISKPGSRGNPSGLSNTAAASGNSNDGPAWVIGADSASLPNYIAMSNLPASHYQRSAPFSQVPMPVTPAIPKSWGADNGSISASTCPAGAAGGPAACSALAVRPGSRRISITNNAGQMTPAGRMSSGSFYNSGTAGGDGQGTASETAGARTSGMKGSRGALLATAAAGAAAAGSPDGAAAVNNAMS